MLGLLFFDVIDVFVYRLIKHLNQSEISAKSCSWLELIRNVKPESSQVAVMH